MALIKCPECNHEISEHAQMCIYCGCPMSKIKELLNKAVLKTTKKTSLKVNSAVFKTLSNEQKLLVEEICHFTEKNTKLRMVEYAQNFGFAKKGKKKMVLQFKNLRDGLNVSFRLKTDVLKTKRIKLTERNLQKIKDSILIVFGDKSKAAVVTPANPKKEKETEKAKTIPKTRKKPAKKTKTRTKKITSSVLKTNAVKNFISKFHKYLITDIKDLKTERREPRINYFIERKKKKYILCWFEDGTNGKFSLKYYLNPIDRYPIEEIIPVLENAFGYAEEIIKIYFESFEPKQNENNEEQENNSVPVIYEAIKEAIYGRKYACPSEISQIAKEVASLVNDEVMKKAIDLKYFKDKNEYQKYRFSFRFSPNFFGHIFSFKNISYSDVQLFYNFYKADTLIKFIKKYEKIYKEQIINNYDSAIHDLWDMINKKDLNYSKARGLSYKLKYVPETVLNEKLLYLESLEHKRIKATI